MLEEDPPTVRKTGTQVEKVQRRSTMAKNVNRYATQKAQKKKLRRIASSDEDEEESEDAFNSGLQSSSDDDSLED